jgi:hypothetical protein
MKVFIAIESLREYAIPDDADMSDVVVGVFKTEEAAFRAAEIRAGLCGEHQTTRMNGKYIVCPNGAILYDVIPCEVA